MIALHITFGILYALLTSNIGLQSSSLVLLYINSPSFAEPSAISFILSIIALFCIHTADSMYKRIFPCLTWLITLYMWIIKTLLFPLAAIVLMEIGYSSSLFSALTTVSILFGISSIILAAMIHSSIKALVA